MSVTRWATFDCYGTLIDWNGGIRRELGRLFPDVDTLGLLTSYHEHEPEVQRADLSRPKSIRTNLPTLTGMSSLPVREPTPGDMCMSPRASSTTSHPQTSLG